jgi:thiamine biosynthesis lipoprotein
MNRKLNIILILFLLCILSSCTNNRLIVNTLYLDEAFSIVPIVSILDEEDKFNNKNLQEDLSDITNKLDAKFNVFKENSLISKVNNNAGINSVEVDEEFLYVIKKAIDVSIETKINETSLYDISIFTIWKEWKFNENYYQYYNYSKPLAQDIINQKLPLVNFENIIINETHQTVFLKEKGMAIDLGSIVKGYAADKVSEYLKENNFHNALIDIGGNIVTLGKNIGTNKKWKVGIQMPYTYNTEIGYIETNSDVETLVTSGVYERYIVELNEETNEHIMYHHILNPNTGYPENNDLLSVTIVTNNSMSADALSTAVFLMGLSAGYNYISCKENTGAVFITKNKEIIITSNLKSRFFVNEEIYLNGYKIINYDLI